MEFQRHHHLCEAGLTSRFKCSFFCGGGEKILGKRMQCTSNSTGVRSLTRELCGVTVGLSKVQLTSVA